MAVRSHHVLAVLACAVLLSACSNGRGSVGEPPVGNSPPPAAPPAPEPALPPTPAPVNPPPAPAPTPEPPAPTPPPPTPVPPPPTPEPPPEPEPEGSELAGYWKGRVIDEESDSERDGVALVDLSGDLQLLVLEDGDDPQFVLHGNLCCDSRADGRVDGHLYLETRESNADLEVRAENGRLTGKFEFRGRDYEFSLSPDRAYDQSLTLQALAGVYTRTTNQQFGPPLTLTLTIRADGTLSGSHSNGCVFSGSVDIPHSSRNMVLLDVEVTDCGTFQSSRRWNGDYRGLGILLRDVATNGGSTRENIFYHSLVGPTWFGPFDVVR